MPTQYLLDLDKVLIETDAQDIVLAAYARRGGSLYDHLLAMTRGTSSYFYHFDRLGSVRNFTDAGQNITDSYSYDAWGNITSETGTAQNPYRYVGAYGVQWDKKPGVYFMQARYYGADIGRFMTMDPLAG